MIILTAWRVVGGTKGGGEERKRSLAAIELAFVLEVEAAGEVEGV